MKKALYLMPVLLLVVLLLTGAGCDLFDKDSKTKTSTKSVSLDEDLGDEDMAMVEEDVFGEDLSDISRYPDSLRSYYAKDQYETDVTYETEDSEEKVREYYEDLLTEQGWTQTGIATDYVDYEKGDEDNPEMLTIYFTPYEEGYLEYELVYSPPLTEEELKEMEEEDEEEIIIE